MVTSESMRHMTEAQHKGNFVEHGCLQILAAETLNQRDAKTWKVYYALTMEAMFAYGTKFLLQSFYQRQFKNKVCVQ